MSRWQRAFWSWCSVLAGFFVVANTVWQIGGKIWHKGFPLHYATRHLHGRVEYEGPALAFNLVVAAVVTVWLAGVLATHRCRTASPCPGREQRDDVSSRTAVEQPEQRARPA